LNIHIDSKYCTTKCSTQVFLTTIQVSGGLFCYCPCFTRVQEDSLCICKTHKF